MHTTQLLCIHYTYSAPKEIGLQVLAYQTNLPVILIVNVNLWIVSLLRPVTVAKRSKACTFFARSEAEIVGSNPNQGMDVSVCVCARFFLCLCTGRGLTTS
jgi:hypothetical protein